MISCVLLGILICYENFANFGYTHDTKGNISNYNFCHLYPCWKGNLLDHASYDIFNEYLPTSLVASKDGLQQDSGFNCLRIRCKTLGQAFILLAIDIDLRHAQQLNGMHGQLWAKYC